MTIETQLADELVQQLNTRLTLDAKRQYLLILEREKLGDACHVTVFPNSTTYEILDAENNAEQIEVNIVVQKAVDPRNVEAIDALLDTMRSIKNLWGENGPLRDVPLAGCIWTGLRHEPLWNADRLLSNKEFVSVITVTYTTEQ